MAVASAGPYTSLQIDNHASTPQLSFFTVFYGRDALLATKSTASKH